MGLLLPPTNLIWPSFPSDAEALISIPNPDISRDHFSIFQLPLRSWAFPLSFFILSAFPPDHFSPTAAIGFLKILTVSFRFFSLCLNLLTDRRDFVAFL